MRSTRLGIALGLLGLLAFGASCGGAGGGDGVIHPRYRSATGSVSRYRVIVREVPVGAPGRSVGGLVDVTVRGTEGEAHALEAVFHDLSFAREAGEPVRADAPIAVGLTLDARRRVGGAPTVADAEGAAALARVLTEGLVLPDAPVGPGGRWDLPPITRALPDGGEVTIPRTATLEGTADGVATVRVEGEGTAGPISWRGARVLATGRVTQRFRVRAADGALVESETETAVELRAALPDETPIGVAVHRARSELRRLSESRATALRHDWRPDVPGRECGARLEAMERRFAQAPRGVDLDGMAAADFEVPQRSDRTPIEEDGPLLVGADFDALRAAVEVVDARRALAVYALAPREVSDADLRLALADLGAAVEVRRVAWGQVVPPSPPRPAGIVALAGRMRREGMEPWDETMRAMLALCPQAEAAYAAALEAPAAERAGQLRDGVLAAYRRCGCEATDLGRLERVMDLRLGGPQIGWAPLSEGPVEDE